MMRYLRCPLLVLLLVVPSTDVESAEPSMETPGERLFAINVRPLLVERCFACHGKDRQNIESGLDLTSRAAMIAGGDSGERVLAPGRAAESLLYVATTGKHDAYRMPPKENDRLTEEQSWAIRDWINAGAPWPDDEKVAAIVKAHAPAGVRVATSGGLSPDWTDRNYDPANLWAYQPLVRPEVPSPAPLEDDGRRTTDNANHSPLATRHAALTRSIRSPIDAFIQVRLNELDVQPAARAHSRTLLRRASFDLTGLPPTPEEVAGFLSDADGDGVAFQRVLDRLLASPHYGEQYGRHWLDVVRYADTAGFANDFERPNAWRYRDYVIRAFNEDKPYDQFLVEQLAGDELDPDDPELLIAAGFLRMGPWEQTGMSVFKITRQQFLDDVTSTVGQALLSHPLQCARCHDHKFDPIPTRDYYRIQAVFATAQFAERDAPFLPGENTSGFDDERRYLQQRIRRYEANVKEIDAKHDRAARAWYDERSLPYAPRNAKLKQGLPENEIAPRHVGLSPEDMGIERICRKNLTRHRWELDRFRPIAYSVYSGKTPQLRNVQSRLEAPDDPLSSGTLEPTAILAGGDPFAPTQPVTPGVMSWLPGSNDTLAASEWNTMPTEVRGRRLAFARWVASADNPLTARSIANRIWQWHLGRGLAGNANNFGAMGAKPTHPELLDWLAAEIVGSAERGTRNAERGASTVPHSALRTSRSWSLKRLHRLIMSSAAYARSTEHPGLQELLAKDPGGKSYARFEPRRLMAEELRDTMLAASGELNREPGGIPVRPEINLEAALQPRQIMGTYAPAYQPSARPEQRNRRSIYAIRIRGLRDPFLEVFNQPGTEDSCERRDASTITPQAFTLFNSRIVHARALAMAARVLAETDSDEAAIERAFSLALGRPPTTDELQSCLAHWRHMTERHRKLTFERENPPTEVRREAVEEMSGETFTFTELLEVYDDHVPDLRPSDVDARTRALAEVCLVLLNSNELVYVY